ncbi:unnamed protein product, partial [Medioppia subpectinata]
PTIKILLLGLDNAGKTTTALHLIGDSLEDIIPTIGFSNLEMRRYEKYRVVVYDLGGGARIRAIWKNYFALIHGIVFVIDSSDISRVLEVKDVIEEVVSNDKISGKPILVFETCSANTRPENGSKIDPSIDSGYKWLLSFVAKNWFQLNNRVETDSNEQFSNEKKSLEERMNRFRNKRFETQEDENDFANKEDFIKNGNPFKAIDDVIRDVEQKKFDMNNSQMNGNFENKNLVNGNKDFGSKNMDSTSSDRDDTSDHSNESNDSNDILTNNSLSDEKDHIDTDQTSGTQTYSIDKTPTRTGDSQTHRHQKQAVDEVIIKSDAKTTKGLDDTSDHSNESNDSNDILTNNSLSDEKDHIDTDQTSGTQTYTIDKTPTRSGDSQTHRHQKQAVDEVIIKSDAKTTKDVESRKSMSPESSEMSITPNRYNNHKKAKRKTKAMRNSKVSPDLSKNS